MKPKSWVLGCDSILHKSYKVFKPKFDLCFIILRPCFTIALFKSTKGTTSHTVPNETRSRKFNIFGSSILLFRNHLDSLNFIFNAIRKTKQTPAAQRYLSSDVSSNRLGLIRAQAFGNLISD